MQQTERKVECPRCSKKMYYEGPTFGGVRGVDGASASLMLGRYKCWNCGEMKEDEPTTEMVYRETKKLAGGVITELKRASTTARENYYA
ncbi:hypothetical protein FY034_17485 (plasmid) [Trichlorobacter lovleyi]|uniref:hypothetical protein n=1 Tax=Trichlorobacter lovleyi TaxID=313985 RepID=UPI00223EAD84|nr:hypothetical protein [Trichlorobacter lovleyi]QOX80816.1 hypothetical protein FY034_17485 [Trichlorobacter lovleyi]